MEIIESKYIIVGAGVSGLTSAYQFSQNGEEDFLLLEARGRIGGRILTKSTIDLGATWFNDGHKHMLEMVRELGVEKFNQYTSGLGIFVYSSMAPAQKFESDSNQNPAYRVAGGSIHLVEKLAEKLESKIKLNTPINSISEVGDKLHIETENCVYVAQKLIVTIPPKLSTQLGFEPKLPEELLEVMNSTHTWMSNAMKVGITFEKPFWREKNLSGTLIGQISPVIELYDHSTIDDTSYSLMGFINESLRDVSADERKEKVLSYIQEHLGSEVREYIHYQEKDWSDDEFTSCTNLKSIYMSPSYGNPVFQNLYMNGKLLFSGAETSPISGGYIEGAIYSGLSAAHQILERE